MYKELFVSVVKRRTAHNVARAQIRQCVREGDTEPLHSIVGPREVNVAQSADDAVQMRDLAELREGHELRRSGQVRGCPKIVRVADEDEVCGNALDVGELV
jgi:hypothetical protein